MKLQKKDVPFKSPRLMIPHRKPTLTDNGIERQFLYPQIRHRTVGVSDEFQQRAYRRYHRIYALIGELVTFHKMRLIRKRTLI